MKQRTYIAIDLKSFYASVECRERGLDPLDTNLVVADESRTDKTICLAVTPSLKSYGISGRGRLFEVKQRVKEANAGRQHDAPGHRLDGTSHFFSELQADPSLAIDFIIAPPRMSYYMEYSTRIYQVYLKYIAPEDIVVYSIDEVFMDVTDYLNTYKLSAHDLAMKIILDVLETTGITATAGIGTNLFLCKVAMDIVAKHIPADKNRMECSPWAMLPSVPSETRTCFTSCSERTRNCSSTMRGAGNRLPLKQLKPIVPAPTASAPVRFCTALMSRKKQSWLSGK